MNNRTANFAVAISGFRKPHNLHVLLHALKDQVTHIPVYLYLDCPINSEFGLSKEVIEDLQTAIVSIFKIMIPHGEVIKRTTHLGKEVGRIQTVTETLKKADRCLYLKDEHFLHPNYIEMIRALMDQLESDDRVGLVNCCGDKNSDLTIQLKKIRTLKQTGRLWAWATWKERWENILPIIDPCMDIYKSYTDSKITRDELRTKLHSYYSYLGSNKEIEKINLGIDDCIAKIFALSNYVTIATYPNYLMRFGQHAYSFKGLYEMYDHCHRTKFCPQPTFDFIWSEEDYNRVRGTLDKKYMIR